MAEAPRGETDVRVAKGPIPREISDCGALKFSIVLVYHPPNPVRGVKDQKTATSSDRFVNAR